MATRSFYRSISIFSHGMSIVVGLVLIWRGIWFLIDRLDIILFGGSHELTAIGGIIIGILILYLPDHDLKELEKL